jgi:hypothetical protein
MGKETPEEAIDRARRRLLIRAVYVPPTVLGIIEIAQSGCAPSPSCNPQNCNPASCHPNNGPCNPDNCNPNTGCNPDNCKPNK